MGATPHGLETLEGMFYGRFIVEFSGANPEKFGVLPWLGVSNMNFIFHNIWDNPSHWLIFFRMVKTTNQYLIF